jgi:ABC-type multidrug transport system permease subunit
MAKTSLEKSHSKASNAKLTLLCLLTAIASTGIWVGIAIIILLANYLVLGICVAAISAVVTFLLIQLLGKFAR